MDTNSADPSSSKSIARAHARALRAQTKIRNFPTVFTEAVLRMCAHKQSEAAPRVIAAYSSYRHEPPTADLIDDLLARGHRVRLPRIGGDALAWVDLKPQTEFSTDHRGIRQPQGPDIGLAGVDLVLLPALGVTLQGDRLGQGGGYYDRALAGIPRHSDGGPLLIAVVYAHEVHEQPVWDTEPHDIRVDGFIALSDSDDPVSTHLIQR